MLWKRSQVAILRLREDQFGYDIGSLFKEARLGGHAQGLHGRDQVFADKLARPWNELGNRAPISLAKHLDHAGIRPRCPQQPVIDIRARAFPDHALKIEVRARHGIERETIGAIPGQRGKASHEQEAKSATKREQFHETIMPGQDGARSRRFRTGRLPMEVDVTRTGVMDQEPQEIAG